MHSSRLAKSRIDPRRYKECRSACSTYRKCTGHYPLITACCLSSVDSSCRSAKVAARQGLSLMLAAVLLHFCVKSHAASQRLVDRMHMLYGSAVCLPRNISPSPRVCGYDSLLVHLSPATHSSIADAVTSLWGRIPVAFSGRSQLCLVLFLRHPAAGWRHLRWLNPHLAQRGQSRPLRVVLGGQGWRESRINSRLGIVWRM